MRARVGRKQWARTEEAVGGLSEKGTDGGKDMLVSIASGLSAVGRTAIEHPSEDWAGKWDALSTRAYRACFLLVLRMER